MTRSVTGTLHVVSNPYKHPVLLLLFIDKECETEKGYLAQGHLIRKAVELELKPVSLSSKTPSNLTLTNLG